MENLANKCVNRINEVVGMLEAEGVVSLYVISALMKVSVVTAKKIPWMRWITSKVQQPRCPRP